MLEGDLKIYTDGSSLSHPRIGGFAFKFVFLDEVSGNEITKDFEYKGIKGATNNQMELKACIEALKGNTENSRYIWFPWSSSFNGFNVCC